MMLIHINKQLYKDYKAAGRLGVSYYVYYNKALNNKYDIDYTSSDEYIIIKTRRQNNEQTRSEV